MDNAQAPTASPVGLPSGVQKRQSWRPLATLAGEALVSGIMTRFQAMGHTARLAAWHQQFTQRVQPWLGWSPLSMALYTEGLPPEDVSAPLRPSPYPHLLQPEIRNQVDFERSRPVVRPTTRQAVSNLTDAVPHSEDLSLLLRSQDRLTAYAMPMAGRLVSQPRLILSVSPTPRQEVRGGFPRQQSLPVGLPEAEQTRANQVSQPLALWTVASEALFPPSTSRVVPTASAPLNTQGAIETLIERTVAPASLPGLALRLVSPEKPVSVVRHPSAATDDGQSMPPGAALSTPVPIAAPPTASLDINAIADKVYQTLQRRQQFERERRGLY